MSEEKPFSMCELCEEQNATVLCLGCHKYYCAECYQYIHKKAKKHGHRAEVFIPIEGAAQASTACPIHSGNKLEFFCVDDAELCCAECAADDKHRGHRVISASEAFNESNGVFSAESVKAQFAHAVEGNSALSAKVDSAIAKIQKEAEVAKEDAARSFREAHKRLNEEERCTLEQLEKAYNEAVDALKRVKDELSVGLENGVVLTRAEQENTSEPVERLGVLARMEKYRRGMEELCGMTLVTTKVVWNDSERKLSLTKRLVNGVSVPINIMFPVVSIDSASVSWDVVGYNYSGSGSGDETKYCVEMQRAAENNDRKEGEECVDEWKEVYAGADKKCVINGLETDTTYNIRVKCIVGKLQGEWSSIVSVKTKKVSIDSAILSGEANKEVFEDTLSEWCGTKVFGLIYRGTRDGFSGSNFHKACDKKGKTLVLVKSNTNHVFGGFASTRWNSSGLRRRAPGSFIFTLTNMYETQPTKFHLKNDRDKSAVCHYGTGYGPVFGGGHDLLMYSNCNTNTGSYSNFPYAYEDTTGKGSSIFSGSTDSNHFNVQEIEVFKVISP